MKSVWRSGKQVHTFLPALFVVVDKECTRKIIIFRVSFRIQNNERKDLMTRNASHVSRQQKSLLLCLKSSSRNHLSCSSSCLANVQIIILDGAELLPRPERGLRNNNSSSFRVTTSGAHFYGGAADSSPLRAREYNLQVIKVYKYTKAL